MKTFVEPCEHGCRYAQGCYILGCSGGREIKVRPYEPFDEEVWPELSVWVEVTE